MFGKHRRAKRARPGGHLFDAFPIGFVHMVVVVVVVVTVIGHNTVVPPRRFGRRGRGLCDDGSIDAGGGGGRNWVRRNDRCDFRRLRWHHHYHDIVVQRSHRDASVVHHRVHALPLCRAYLRLVRNAVCPADLVAERKRSLRVDCVEVKPSTLFVLDDS